MKKSITIIIAAIAITALVIFLRGEEDTWIKDEKGIYIKHGNPLITPIEVKLQQDLIQKAFQLYDQKKSEGMNFSSQCLGTIENYAVDIVHDPRTSEDNNNENQCPDFINGKATHFIEIDKNRNIVRIN